MLESTDVIPFTACLRNWQCLILSTEGHWCPSFSVTLYCSQSMTPLQQLMCANPRLYICVCLCVSVCILAQPLLTSVCSLLFSRHTLHLSLSHSPSMSLSLSLSAVPLSLHGDYYSSHRLSADTQILLSSPVNHLELRERKKEKERKDERYTEKDEKIQGGLNERPRLKQQGNWGKKKGWESRIKRRNKGEGREPKERVRGER